MRKPTSWLFLIAVICWGCSGKSVAINSNGTASRDFRTLPRSQAGNGQLRYKAPDGWISEKPASDMRVAQYKLPRAEGDNEDAILVLYYFGQGQGGSAQANIDRWINQMQQPDGHTSKERAKTETLTVNGLQVTMVDVAGTYSGGMGPGGMPPASETSGNKSNYRLRAAIIETPKGSYFVKLTGPQKTVNRWDQAYMDYINSFEFK